MDSVLSEKDILIFTIKQIKNKIKIAKVWFFSFSFVFNICELIEFWAKITILVLFNKKKQLKHFKLQNVDFFLVKYLMLTKRWNFELKFQFHFFPSNKIFKTFKIERFWFFFVCFEFNVNKSILF